MPMSEDERFTLVCKPAMDRVEIAVGEVKGGIAEIKKLLVGNGTIGLCARAELNAKRLDKLENAPPVTTDVAQLRPLSTAEKAREWATDPVALVTALYRLASVVAIIYAIRMGVSTRSDIPAAVKASLTNELPKMVFMMTSPTPLPGG